MFWPYAFQIARRPKYSFWPLPAVDGDAEEVGRVYSVWLQREVRQLTCACASVFARLRARVWLYVGHSSLQLWTLGIVRPRRRLVAPGFHAFNLPANWTNTDSVRPGILPALHLLRYKRYHNCRAFTWTTARSKNGKHLSKVMANSKILNNCIHIMTLPIAEFQSNQIHIMWNSAEKEMQDMLIAQVQSRCHWRMTMTLILAWDMQKWVCKVFMCDTWHSFKNLSNPRQILGPSNPAHFLDNGHGTTAHLVISAFESGRFLDCAGIVIGVNRFSASLKAVEIAKKYGFLKTSIQLIPGDVLTSTDVQLSTYNVYNFFDKVCIDA